MTRTRDPRCCSGTCADPHRCVALEPVPIVPSAFARWRRKIRASMREWRVWNRRWNKRAERLGKGSSRGFYEP